jgi:predicted RNA binding protein YcfA (HicA-like mRNA interferase family)
VLVKALNKIGFNLTRQLGSHMALVKENEEKITVVVPKHREIAKGTLLSIISQSGLSKEEFFKLLKK